MPENFEQGKSGLWLPKEESGHKISPEEMEKRKEIVKEAKESDEKIMKERQEAEERRKKQEAWLKDPLRGTRVRERIEEAEKTPEPPKPEEVVEPDKIAEPEREKLMRTELDPEYVLGKERAKLAKELGERMRAKSAGEVKAAQTPEKEPPQKQEKREKREKTPFSLKGFLRELDMQQTLKLVEALEKFAKREKTKEKPKKEPAAKPEKSPKDLPESFLGDAAIMRQTLKLVEAVEKAAEKAAEKGKNTPLYKFLEKIHWKQIIKNKEKLEKKIEKIESEKKPSAKREKHPVSLKEVLKKLGMNQSLKIWKSAEEFAKKRNAGESWRKFLEKIEESKGDIKWRLRESKWQQLKKKLDKGIKLNNIEENPPEQKMEAVSEKPPEIVESDEIKEARKLLEEAEKKEKEVWKLYQDALLKDNEYAKSYAAENDAWWALHDEGGGKDDELLKKRHDEALDIITNIAQRIKEANPDIANLWEEWLDSNSLIVQRRDALEKLLNK